MVVLVKFPLEIALLQSPLLKILFWRKVIPVQREHNRGQSTTFCQDLTLPLQIKKVTAQSCPWPKHLLNISVEDNLTEFLILRARGLPREANYDISFQVVKKIISHVLLEI